jgi:hypothetical protein
MWLHGSMGTGGPGEHARMAAPECRGSASVRDDDAADGQTVSAGRRGTDGVMVRSTVMACHRQNIATVHTLRE